MTRCTSVPTALRVSVPENICREPAVNSLRIIEGPQILVLVFELLKPQAYRIKLGYRRSGRRLQYFLKLFIKFFALGKLRDHGMRTQMSKIPGVRNCGAQPADFVDELDLLSFDPGPDTALGDFVDLRNRDIAAVRNAF